MGLDVNLILWRNVSKEGSGIFVRESGRVREISHEEWNEKFPNCELVTIQYNDSKRVYWANITHNLASMAREAGIYRYLWRPEEVNVMCANQLIAPLENGLELLQSDRDRFEKFDPKNGWGGYDTLVEFVSQYLSVCQDYPQARISVSR
jgi:hypothetical protein